jgi:acetylglutamate kinase
MKFVVKLGGAALENPELLDVCCKAIYDLVSDGNEVAVVHGGGVQLTRTLAQMGKKSEFISGLRVTDAETRDAALMVLAGRVNKSLVATLGKAGQPAMGLSISASSARLPPPIRAGSKRSGRWARCP